MNHSALRDSTRCRMPEHDPHDQTDPAGESFDHFDDEAAVPTDQGADSADSTPASPAADSSRAEVGDLDQSLYKIDKLADALAKLSQASADDAFNAKLRRLAQQATDAEQEFAGEPAFTEPTEQSQEPVDSQVESSHRPEIDEAPPPAPEVPVESFEPSGEQIVASPLSDSETTAPPFDPAEVVRPLEAFALSEVDETQASSADEGVDGDEPQQSEHEETSQTSENVSDEVMNTPPENRSLDPDALEQESAVLEEHSHADESEPAVLDDVEEKAVGSAAESRLDAEVVDAPLESFADSETESSDEIAIGETADIEEQSIEATDPPVEMFELTAQEPTEPAAELHDVAQDVGAPSDEPRDNDASPNERSDAFSDNEATSIDADQPDQSLAGEQDSESEAFVGVANEPEDHEPIADSSSDTDDAESTSATFTAEELEAQIGEIISSFAETPQASPPRWAARAAAADLANESASLAPQTDIELGWLARELDVLLNPGTAEPVSERQSESSEVGDPVIEGATDQQVDAPELSDQGSAVSDERSAADDPPVAATDTVDGVVDLGEIAAEQAEPVSKIDAPQSASFQEESAPAEPIGAETSTEDEPVESAPAEPLDSTGDDPTDLAALLDDPIRSEVSPPVRDSEPEAPTQETPADESPDDVAVETTEGFADESSEDIAVESMPTEPPPAGDATEPDESATSAEDDLSDITAQLDELLDGKVESSPGLTPSDPIEVAPPVIDTAAPPEEVEPTHESLEDATEIEAPVSPESAGVDEPDDFMASPADEIDSAVDAASVTEVDQQMDEGVGSTVDTTEGDATDDAEAQAFMSDTEPDDATSTEAEDQTLAEADASAEEPDTAAEPDALDAESASESGTDFMMNESDHAEDDAQPEAEAVDFESEEEPDAAPQGEASAEPDVQSQDRTDDKSNSSKDDDDEAGARRTEALKDAAVATVRLVRLHQALERIEPVAVPILRRVNYPLRYVPKAVRPIVDWVALSLLFWVPIVWVIALLAS